ncbi:MAG: hypothetical protein JXQ71_15805 [Verrucomicrobia bacterium]|nr:hypothetical protein [Verrucomicrobiota bacterium]
MPPHNRHPNPRIARSTPHACWLLGTLLLAGCSPEPGPSHGVHFVVHSGEARPTSTFELRFDTPAVAPAQVGVPAAPSPLLIIPPLPGRFHWLTTRSGVFTPTTPPALDTPYHFALRPGWRGPDGRPLRARLAEVWRTPPFSAWNLAAPTGSTTDAGAEPVLKLQFNAPVDPAKINPFVTFRSRAGLVIPARFRPPDREDHFPEPPLPELEWDGAGTLASTPSVHRGTREVAASSRPAPAGPPWFPRRLVVWPARPLSAGEGWRLVLARGLPAARRDLRLKANLEMPIGDVRPFEVVSADAENVIHHGPSLSLHFSKPLDPKVTSTNVMRWISVDPTPDDLAARVQYNHVRLRARFKLGQSYAVTVHPGLPSREPFLLAAAWTRQVSFDPIPPRLYFPAFARDQLAGGNRHFHLLTVNVPRFRLRAKCLDRHTLVHALQGYESYFRRHRTARDWQEPFQAVDFNMVPGQVVHDREFAPRHDIDVPETLQLDWDEILGGRRHAAVFLAADRITRADPLRPQPGTQTLIQLTDLGLLWKGGPDRLHVFVFSHARATPVPGVTVRLLAADNTTLAEAQTDREGQARLPASRTGAYLMAEAGDDLHAVALSDAGTRLRHDPDPPDGPDNQGDHGFRLLLFSDRTVYRPGETLHLKAFARDWTDHGFAIPARARGTLQAFDAKGRMFLETPFALSEFGAFDHDLRVPEGVRGQYWLRLNVRRSEFQLAFDVQDVAVNTFEIDVPAKPSYLAGEPVALPVTARYYLGKPLSRAQLTWALDATDTGFATTNFADYHFCGGEALTPEQYGPASTVLHGHTLYTAASNVVIAPAIPINPQAPQPRRVDLLVSLTDLNQQTLTKSTRFTVHSSAFYLGLNPFPGVVSAGAPLAVDAVAVGADGRRWPEPVSAQIHLRQVQWHAVRVEGAGRVHAYRNEAHLTNHLTHSLTLSPTPGPLELPAPIVPSTPGQYLLVLTASDPAGRHVLTALSFHVAGKDELAWNYRNDVRLDLVPDRPRYLPGQTAEILVKTPLSGLALVTLERDRVLRSFLTRLEGNAPTVRVPLETNDAPNVFVAVTLLRGYEHSPTTHPMPEFRHGTCRLDVDRPEGRLDVRVAPDAPAYRPRQPVHVVTTILDSQHRPAAGAEVTLYAVDEGILSLQNYRVPDPCTLFHRPRPLEVVTRLSLPSLLPEAPDQQRFHNKGYLAGGGGRPHPTRQDFLPCAFWQATLLTDTQGQIAATFPAPDSLTRYRIIAVAQTRHSRFGTGQSAFEVNKPLMIEPALPRFANVTDRLAARALVLNHTDQAGTVLVTLQLDTKAAPDPPPTPASSTPPVLTNALHLPPHGSAPVEFPLRVVAPGDARWTWNVRFTQPHAADFVDSVLSTLPIGILAPLLTEIHLERAPATATNLLARVNPLLLEGQGTATVRVANTRLIELAPAVAHLLHYPYGCLEQTSSSLLPWIVLGNLPGLAPFLDRPPAEIREVIRTGLDRLFAMQTPSGGLACWPDCSTPTGWGSAYAALIVALAQRHHIPVPASHFEPLRRYLSGRLRTAAGTPDPVPAGERSLTLYALAVAGHAEPAYHEQFFQQRALLSAQNRVLLALAILESRGPAAMVDELLQHAPGSSAPENDGFDSPARDAALQLLAWCRHRPADPRVDVLAAELARSQTGSHWGTTQGNAWAIYALAEYAVRIEGRPKPARGQIVWGADTVAFTLDNQPAVVEHAFALTPERAHSPLAVLNPGGHPLYLQTTIQTRSASPAQPRQDRGFHLTRRYARVDPDGHVHPHPQDLRVGDLLAVTLHLATHAPAHYVALDDPLPAILEAVHPRFVSQQAQPASTAASATLDAQPFETDFHELRRDRALFFRDHLPAGTYAVRYLARVRAAGTATAPPAKVEEMYHPDRFGLTDTVQLTSRPLDADSPKPANARQ